MLCMPREGPWMTFCTLETVLAMNADADATSVLAGGKENNSYCACPCEGPNKQKRDMVRSFVLF
jgi:hypothetical protein